MAQLGDAAVNDFTWTCVRCKSTEDKIGHGFIHDRRNNTWLCPDCVDAVLAEWLATHAEEAVDE